ncbi:MAG: helix-turn-helix transcriptional regulator [Candidatus Omnitrophica bacterium]|nr:helix-turn-helix transcriptional regulator [Candidatus Omnitrophota bacterium]
METFGSYLKELRLLKGYGLRAFAEKIGMYPSNLSDIERGKKSPPRDAEKLAFIAVVLGIDRNSDEWVKLHDLSVRDVPGRLAPDVSKYVSESKMVPLLLRTTAEKKLTKEELLKLIETIKKKF